MLPPVKLYPALKDYLWGGTDLRDKFGKGAGTTAPIAESWELSTHPDGESLTAPNGPTLSAYLHNQALNVVGTKSPDGTIPILVKFIDAREALSVQVHPWDAYARCVEGDNGKTEMWVVMAHKPGAVLYYGLREALSKEQARAEIGDGTILDALNRVEVADGDVFFIPAGTIHAIGAGMTICEIQQRSNVTYRLYDYGRVGKNGIPRQLHTEKALDVASLEALIPCRSEELTLCADPRYTLKALGCCGYFQTYRYDMAGEVRLSTSEKTFVCLVALAGSCRLTTEAASLTLQGGDAVFLPAQKAEHTLKGTGTVLAVSL